MNEQKCRLSCVYEGGIVFQKRKYGVNLWKRNGRKDLAVVYRGGRAVVLIERIDASGLTNNELDQFKSIDQRGWQNLLWPKNKRLAAIAIDHLCGNNL